MQSRAERLAASATNREVGFFPSESTIVTAYFDGSAATRTHPFMWIEGYFDAQVLTTPIAAVWDGVSYFDDAKTVKLVNPVQFAYSGQPKTIRGIYLVASGKDYLGNTITSANIDETGFEKFIVSGGARPAS